MDQPLIQSLLGRNRSSSHSHTTARPAHINRVARDHSGDRIERLLDVRERRGQEEGCQAQELRGSPSQATK